jgi:MFS family permease
MNLTARLELNIEQSNFHHLVQNTVWFGLATPATARFLSVYAIHVGATPFQLGLIASLPGFAAFVTAALAQWWIRRHQTTIDAVRIPSFGLRTIFLLLAFTPLFPARWQPIWIIIAVVVPALAEGISSVAFMVAMREAVSEKLLTPLLSRRQFAMNVTLGLGTLVFGFWLENAPFPFNYQIMFLISFGFVLVSWWHTMRVKVPPAEHTTATKSTTRIWNTPGFLTVVFVTIATHIAYFSIAPIITLRLVNELGASEQFMAYFGLAELAAAAFIAIFTSQIVARIGNRALITWSMLGTGLSALVLALAPSLPLTLLAAALTGASWTAANVSLFGFFAEKTPLKDSPRYTTVYIQIIYIGLFIGPLIGSSLADMGMNLVTVLMCGALLRFFVGIMTSIHFPLRFSSRRAIFPIVK